MAVIEAIGKIGDPASIPYLEKAYAKVSKGDQDRITRVIKDLQSKR